MWRVSSLNLTILSNHPMFLCVVFLVFRSLLSATVILSDSSVSIVLLCCLRSRAMHKTLLSTPSIFPDTISPSIGCCGPRSATQPLGASFSPRRRPAGASYGISIGWLRMRSPLFGGRASSRVGVPHRRWPCTQAATGQPKDDSSAHDPPAHPSEQRRLRLRGQKVYRPLA